MRKDMHKVIVEQERYDGGGLGRQSRNSGRGRSKFRADSDPDSYVGPETNRKLVYKYEYKSFRDHLSPLYRFLKQNVGRPWDKVYSEVCSQADARSVTGYHLRDHVHLYVCTDLDAAEEEIERLKQGSGLWQWRTFSAQFYVDAKGFLRKFPKHATRRGATEPPEFYVDADNAKLHYVMINGSWYVEDMSKPIPSPRWARDDEGNLHMLKMPPLPRRQLSSKEIARLGLRDLPVKDRKAT